MSQKQDQCGVEMMQKIKVLSAKSLEQSKVLSFKLGAGQILALSALPVVGNDVVPSKFLPSQVIHPHFFPSTFQTRNGICHKQ